MYVTAATTCWHSTRFTVNKHLRPIYLHDLSTWLNSISSTVQDSTPTKLVLHKTLNKLQNMIHLNKYYVKTILSKEIYDILGSWSKTVDFVNVTSLFTRKCKFCPRMNDKGNTPPLNNLWLFIFCISSLVCFASAIQSCICHTVFIRHIRHSTLFFGIYILLRATRISLGRSYCTLRYYYYYYC